MKTTKLLEICAAVVAITFSLSMTSAKRQTMTTTDSLMRYEWVSTIDFSRGTTSTKEIYTVFDLDSMKYVTVYDVNHKNHRGSWGQTQIIANPYYVSATKDKIFREDQVGKRNNGRYIIVQLPQNIRIYEILQLDNKCLKLEILDEIILGNPVTTRYARPRQKQDQDQQGQNQNQQ